MYLSFSTGLDRYYGLLDLAVGMGIVVQNGATYALADGTKLGYAKTWRNDEQLWEKTIIPGLESKMKAEWAYGNNNNEIIPEEGEENE
jgi:hypothetical protein